MIARKQIREHELLTVNVLILIDHHIHHALAPLVELFRKTLQNIQRHQNQVIKVKCVIFLLLIEIAVINLHPLVVRFVRQFQQMVFGHFATLFIASSLIATIYTQTNIILRRKFRKKRNVIKLICLAPPDKIEDTADFQILERIP